MAEETFSPIRRPHGGSNQFIIWESGQIPSSSYVDDIGFTKYVMLDFFIKYTLVSEDEDEEFFNHHGKDAAVFEAEHEFEEDFEVFEVFDTIKYLVTV